ncbi:hypothetical protein ANN_23433 [Periplaneta americana]|uniref:Uncharacterized protein n=1 Tax=Periplaneta americana TaxID=6978 RepID=A0ABQ8SL51_PERAM|nr:hypothetical protein ANN_23433 [Periplaneta americana]
MDLRDVGYDDREWINLSQDRDQWRAYVRAAITSGFLKKGREHENKYISIRNRWIGRGGPVAWPPRSPDLTCLDFFLWGHMKQLVYETVVETEEDLAARITVAADAIADMPGIFERTRQSMVRRCTACIQANGRAFEQFL